MGVDHEMSLRDEEVLAAILAVISIFTIINISPEVGTFYSFGVMLYLFPLMAGSVGREWVVEFITKRQNLFKSLGISGVMLVVWVFISIMIIARIEPSTKMITPGVEVFAELSRYTQVPVLSQDPSVRFVIYGVFIPIVESLFFLSFWLMFLAKKVFRLPYVKWYRAGTPQFLKMLWVCALVGATGSLFHLTVRMAADFALFVDFLFFTISALLVFKYKRLFEATGLHVGINSGVLLLGGA